MSSDTAAHWGYSRLYYKMGCETGGIPSSPYVLLGIIFKFNGMKRYRTDACIWHELKSHLCTLNRVEDHINECTLRSRPCPNTAGKFGLGLSALPQKLHQTHTACWISLPILCRLCTKEAQSDGSTYCRYCMGANTVSTCWSHIRTDFLIIFSYKTNSP